MLPTHWSRMFINGALALLLLCCGSFLSAQAARSSYQLQFEVELTAGQSTAGASIKLTQPNSLLRELRFRAPSRQFSRFAGDGSIQREGDILIWRPPASGGELRYNVLINHERQASVFDALVADDWALFRGDDVFPPAHIRRQVGSTGSSTLVVRAPKGWSTVTPFPTGPGGHRVVDNPGRMFDRPVGWIIAGHLGVRRDSISGIDVSVAAPKGAGAERISMLALLRWTLPYLTREMDNIPGRLSVVSANDPMWRGGLSAPNSIFMHADRPLLSENGTSTLLHETTHMLLRFPTDAQHDWIDEGIAEYITLEILRRSGTISDERFTATIDGFRKRAKTVTSMATLNAHGAVTASAVVLFHSLDLEIQERTADDADIFTLVRRLVLEKKPVDLARLRELAMDISAAGNATDKSLKSLAADQVPGLAE